MAILVSTQFQNAFADLDDPAYPIIPSNQQVIAGRGINYGNAYTCSVGYVGKQLLPYDQLYTAIAVRAQYGFLPLVGASFPFSFIEFSGPSALSTYDGAAFGAFVEVLANGSIRLDMPNGGTSFAPTSSAGVVALDGSIHAFQIALSFPDHQTCTYQVAVNNVVVLSGSAVQSGTSFFPCGPGTTTHWWYRQHGVVPCPKFDEAGVNEVIFASRRTGNHLMSTCVEAIIEDVATITNYPAATASPAEANGCTAVIPVATVTVLAIDCVSSLIYITGTHFLPTSVVRLWGPPNGDEPTPLHIVSQTDTEIVVQLPAAFISGQYCALVENP